MDNFLKLSPEPTFDLVILSHHATTHHAPRSTHHHTTHHALVPRPRPSSPVPRPRPRPPSLVPRPSSPFRPFKIFSQICSYHLFHVPRFSCVFRPMGLLGLFGVFMMASCSQTKDTFINRTFHNLSGHYNGYYNAGVKLLEGTDRLAEQHEDHYDRTLRVYRYANAEKAKSVYPQMDDVIKRTGTVISRHTIYDKTATRNRTPNTGSTTTGCFTARRCSSSTSTSPRWRRSTTSRLLTKGNDPSPGFAVDRQDVPGTYAAQRSGKQTRLRPQPK